MALEDDRTNWHHHAAKFSRVRWNAPGDEDVYCRYCGEQLGYFVYAERPEHCPENREAALCCSDVCAVKWSQWYTKNEEGGLSVIERCRRILDRHSYEEIDHILVDPTTANAILTVHDGLKAENQRKFVELPWPYMAEVAWNVIGKARKK